MKRADMKPGVVYGEGRGTYSTPDPLVILSEPADKQLWTSVWRHDGKSRLFIKSPGKLRRGSWSTNDTGYPVVRLRRGYPHFQHATPKALAALAEVTLEDFTRATEKNFGVEYEGEKVELEFGVACSLANVRGTYDGIVRAREAADRRRQAQDARRAEEKQRAELVKNALRPLLESLGVTARLYTRDYGEIPVEVTMDGAELSWLLTLAESYSKLAGESGYLQLRAQSAHAYRRTAGMDASE